MRIREMQWIMKFQKSIVNKTISYIDIKIYSYDREDKSYYLGGNVRKRTNWRSFCNC